MPQSHPYLLRARPRLRLAGGCDCSAPPAAETAVRPRPSGALLTAVSAAAVDPRAMTLRRS